MRYFKWIDELWGEGFITILLIDEDTGEAVDGILFNRKHAPREELDYWDIDMMDKDLWQEITKVEAFAELL